MGSFIKSEKPQPYRAPTYTISTPVSATEDAPETPEVAEGEDRVCDVVRRASRGRGSTIQTSFRGVLSEAGDLVPQRKNLLGE